ncbi:MAG: hypothetical protein JSS45_09520 [Proteobacteria bacterium]|nr:hypothetical protein [Pseudomonadota bacterium]
MIGYQHLLNSGVPMRLSSIAASEFAIKQPFTELALNNFRPLDFNLIHAHEAARLWNAGIPWVLHRGKLTTAGQTRPRAIEPEFAPRARTRAGHD